MSKNKKINLDSYSIISDYLNNRISSTGSPNFDSFVNEYIDEIKDKYFISNSIKKPLDILTELNNYLSSQIHVYSNLAPSDRKAISVADEYSIAVLTESENILGQFIYDEVKNVDLSSVLDMLDNQIEAESNIQISKSKNFDCISNEHIQSIYDMCVEYAIKKEGEESLSKIYLNSIFNPETTTIDKYNLLLNLNFIKNLFEENILDIVYDDSIESVDNDNIRLENSHWTDILNQDKDLYLKYIEIADRNFNFWFKTALFNNVAEKTDRKFISKNNNELDNFISGKKKDIKDYLLDYIDTNSSKESVLFVTTDIEPYIPITILSDIPRNEKSQVNFVGYWNKRKVYVLNTKEIYAFKNLDKSVFYLEKGNRIVINPTKPIVYMNVIENPFLLKPVLDIYSMGRFEILMTKTNFLYITDEIL